MEWPAHPPLVGGGGCVKRGEHKVVDELTLDRQEQRVEDATRKETKCQRR